MECPYCKKEMEEGKIYKDRYNLKWVGDTEDKDFGPFTFGPKNAVKLTNGEEMYMIAFVCKECRKLIADIKTD